MNPYTITTGDDLRINWRGNLLSKGRPNDIKIGNRNYHRKHTDRVYKKIYRRKIKGMTHDIWMQISKGLY